ncbi:MAG: hypothetical protein RBS49_00880 [Sphaerochaeta sp.]|nr:hypothetical protein [Sphaerochaeta sp.]MDX9914414.1 hypothetical protein [Sphaerochaeta sp.]
MREQDSWQLLSIGEIPLEKVEKNLRELATFMTTSFEVIRSILRSYHPLTTIKEIIRNMAEPSRSVQERATHRALLAYLSTLLPYARMDRTNGGEITVKEYRRLLMSYEELMRKSVRTVDNTALRLRSTGAIRGDNLMLAYQEEALAFLERENPMSIEEQHRALQYRLQPFNTLISEVFPAKLDGLLSAFKSLAERTPTTLEAWEVVGHTSLSEQDAHILSVEMGSKAWDDEIRLPTTGPAVVTHPFSRLRSTYYCFDGKRLLYEGYLVIKEAVVRAGSEYQQRWDEIEETKSRLLPITFFTAMLPKMDWQRDYRLGEGTVDALFERDDDRVMVQIPWADWARQAINPIAESGRAIEEIAEAQAKERLVAESGERAIIVDCRDRIAYPLTATDGVLHISFCQLASIGTSWEGVAAIKKELDLAPKPIQTLIDYEEDREDEEEELDYLPSGSSYFTTMFNDTAVRRDEEEEDEETADEMFNAADQIPLFDFDDENLFSYEREVDDDDDDDAWEHESEAYSIIEPQEIEEFKIPGGALSMADEEMESGSPDLDITYYGPGEDEDDADELLELIKEPQVPARGFILAEAVSRASQATQAEAAADEIVIQQEPVAPRIVDPSLHPTIAQIIAHLPVAEGSVFVHFAESGDAALLAQTASLIEEAKRAQALDNRDKMFSVPGLDLTIVVAGGHGDAVNDWDRRNSVGALMYLQKKSHWSMIQLQYDTHGTLVRADERIISAQEFSTSDWKYVASLAQRILERRRTQ